jgi:hypothetical protein
MLVRPVLPPKQQPPVQDRYEDAAAKLTAIGELNRNISTDVRSFSKLHESLTHQSDGMRVTVEQLEPKGMKDPCGGWFKKWW